MNGYEFSKAPVERHDRRIQSSLTRRGLRRAHGTRALKDTAKVNGPLRGRFIQPTGRRHNLGKDKADAWGYYVAASADLPQMGYRDLLRAYDF